MANSPSSSEWTRAVRATGFVHPDHDPDGSRSMHVFCRVTAQRVLHVYNMRQNPAPEIVHFKTEMKIRHASWPTARPWPA